MYSFHTLLNINLVLGTSFRILASALLKDFTLEIVP